MRRQAGACDLTGDAMTDRSSNVVVIRHLFDERINKGTKSITRRPNYSQVLTTERLTKEFFATNNCTADVNII